MRLLLGVLFLIILVAGCKKDKTPTPEPTLAPTKWELIPGHYKVYDSTGVFLYEMDITHSIGTSVQGYRVDSLTFINFDDNFTFTAPQNQCSDYPNCIRIGSLTEVHDSIDNRWNIFGYGTDIEFNNFRNDTIIFYFQKQNMPYWWNDGTQYFNENLKHIAVKQ
jgi:hypothetical protein